MGGSATRMERRGRQAQRSRGPDGGTGPWGLQAQERPGLGLTVELAAPPPNPTRELARPHPVCSVRGPQTGSRRHTGKHARAGASGKLGPAPTLGTMLRGLGQATLPLWDPASLVCRGLTPGEGLPRAEQSHPVLQGQAGGPASKSQLCRSPSHDLGRGLRLPELGHSRPWSGGTESPSWTVPRTVGPGPRSHPRSHPPLRPDGLTQVVDRLWPQAPPPWRKDNGTYHRVTVRAE